MQTKRKTAPRKAVQRTGARKKPSAAEAARRRRVRTNEIVTRASFAIVNNVFAPTIKEAAPQQLAQMKIQGLCYREVLQMGSAIKTILAIAIKRLPK